MTQRIYRLRHKPTGEWYYWDSGVEAWYECPPDDPDEGCQMRFFLAPVELEKGDPVYSTESPGKMRSKVYARRHWEWVSFDLVPVE